MGKTKLPGMQIIRLSFFLLLLGCQHNVAGDVYSELVSAIIAGRASAVHQIMKSGADINEANKYGRTPLMYATGIYDSNPENKGDSENTAVIVRMLLEAGAKVDAQDDDGNTALSIAVFHGRYDSTRLLLEYGANPNHSHNGITVLMVASYQCVPALARLLVVHGANVALRDLNGRTAKDIALKKGCDEVVRVLQN